MGQVVANLIAGAAAIISVLTWWVDRRRGKRNEDRQKELDEAHGALKVRQLALDEQMLKFAREMQQKADVRATVKHKELGSENYTLTFCNAGRGPALGVQARLEGYISDASERLTDWEEGNLDNNKSRRFVKEIPDRPIERLDSESQPYTVRFTVEWPGFSGPIFLTLSWRNSGSEEKQVKRIQLSSHDL